MLISKHFNMQRYIVSVRRAKEKDDHTAEVDAKDKSAVRKEETEEPAKPVSFSQYICFCLHNYLLNYLRYLRSTLISEQ